MASSVLIEDGLLFVDVDGLCHTPAKPVGLALVQDIHILGGDSPVVVVGRMMSHRLGRVVVLWEPFGNAPFRLTHISSATVFTFNVINHP